MQDVRLRFAPSPTGALHIGGVRTALYNYLYAKQNNGKFILRIEDTDQTRFVEGAENYILSALEWCGIPPSESPKNTGDFGPYRQSERKNLYQDFILQLMKTDFAYYAFDTAEDLDVLRKNAEKEGTVFTYNHISRKNLNNSIHLSEEEVKAKIEDGIPYVIRFKMPEDRILILQDEIRGEFTVNTKDLDDKVLVKNDGMPTYHLANVIDDHLMQISHVIRGEEWLPSMPLHVLTYEAMDWNAPTFAHLPLILKPTGSGKLSKRDGAKFGFPVFPLEWKESEEETYMGFKEDGYFPEALLNILAFLGWTPNTEKEVLSLEEMVALFDIKKVHKSGARFDIQKAKHINRQYLLLKSNEELKELLTEYLDHQNIIHTNIDLIKIIDLVKERASFVKDIYFEAQFFFENPTEFEAKDLKKVWKEDTKEILLKFSAALENIDCNESAIQGAIKSFCAANEIGMGKIMMPLRLSLVGGMKGPDVPKIIEILGITESLKRMQFLISSQD